MRKLNFLIGAAYPVLFILGSVVSASLRLLNIFSKSIGKADCGLPGIELIVDLRIDVPVFRKPPIFLPCKWIANIQPNRCFVL